MRRLYGVGLALLLAGSVQAETLTVTLEVTPEQMKVLQAYYSQESREGVERRVHEQVQAAVTMALRSSVQMEVESLAARLIDAPEAKRREAIAKALEILR